MSNALHKSFSTLLKHHSRGFALYHPVPRAKLAVGSLGKFDDDGRWHVIYNDIRLANVSEPYNGSLALDTIDDGKCDIFTSRSASSLSTTLGVTVEYYL